MSHPEWRCVSCREGISKVTTFPGYPFIKPFIRVIIVTLGEGLAPEISIYFFYVFFYDFFMMCIYDFFYDFFGPYFILCFFYDFFMIIL